MRELSIALGLIVQGSDYILQFRSGDPKIGAVNLIGCFGGKLETGEKPISAVCRDLAEETNLRPSISDFTKLGIVRVIADYKLEDVRIKAHVYKINIGSEVIKASEGQLVRLYHKEVADKLQHMTPGTRAVFEKFVLSKRKI